MRVCTVVLVFLVVRSATVWSKKHFSANKEKNIVDKAVLGCLESSERFSCFSEKAATAIERSMNWDIPLFDGVKLLRNTVKIDSRSEKSLTGVNKLINAFFNFINTHKISIDLSEPPQSNGRTGDVEGGRDGGGGGGGGGDGGGSGGLFNVDKKDLQKEKKYYRYAFMVLLGIFGLTGPLVMKILGIAAAHSLLAAKAALIIVGSVALKKLFEKEDSKPKIKVHTVASHDHEEQDYDRMSYNHIPYGYSGYFASTNRPYSAYAGNDFAPILYGTPYNSKKGSKSR